MSTRPPGRRAEFVARDTYRRRRMIDAAGLLPVLGALLFLVPLLWIGAQVGEPGGAPRTSHVMLYLFAVWAILVVLSALVSRGLGAGSDAQPPEDGGHADMDASEDAGGGGPPERRG